MIKTRTLTLSLALAAVLVASMALAYGPRTAQRFAAPQGAAAANRGPVAELAGQTHADLAALLGISQDELAAQRLAGQTVADLLVEHGLTTAEASATLAEKRDARIDAAVAAGTLDAQRAAFMKSRTGEAIAAMLTREAGPQAGSMWGPAGADRAGLGVGPRTQRGAYQDGRFGMGGGPGHGIHQPGTRFNLPGN
ncbi:MAG: hypothetical protein P8Y02_11805 [Deinococcales bacterium]|jgi:hypothetical protein